MQPLRSDLSYTCKLTLSFGAYEFLEVLVGQAHRVILQANARSQVPADVGHLRLGAAQDRGQIRQGNRPRQGDQGSTKSRHLGGGSALGKRAIELLPKDLGQRLSVSSQPIESGGRAGSIQLEGVGLHPWIAAGEMVEIISPGERCSSPPPSHVLARFLPVERLNLSAAVKTRKLKGPQSPGSCGDDEADVPGLMGQSNKFLDKGRRLLGHSALRRRDRVVRRVDGDDDQRIRMLSSQRA